MGPGGRPASYRGGVGLAFHHGGLSVGSADLFSFRLKRASETFIGD